MHKVVEDELDKNPRLKKKVKLNIKRKGGKK